MNGNSTLAGPESADTGEPGHRGVSIADTFRLLRASTAALEARGEWRLAREIQDACARYDSEVIPSAAFILPLPFGEGQRGGEGVHGEDPQAEEVG